MKTFLYFSKQHRATGLTKVSLHVTFAWINTVQSQQSAIHFTHLQLGMEKEWNWGLSLFAYEKEWKSDRKWEIH